MYMDGRLFKLNWVSQLQNQLNKCIQMLDKLHKLNKKVEIDMAAIAGAIEASSIALNMQTRLSKRNSDSDDLAARLKIDTKKQNYLDSTHEVANRRKQTEQALIITYLNFELFRNEYTEFRHVISLNLFHVFILFSFNSLLTYYILSSAFERLTPLDIGLYGCVNLSAVVVLNYLVMTSGQDSDFVSHNWPNDAQN